MRPRARIAQRAGGCAASHPNRPAAGGTRPGRRRLGRAIAPRRRRTCHRGLREADFSVPPSLAGPKVVFINCHACGHGTARVPAGGICPKCGGHSWDRFTLSARLVPQVQA